jgi:hypothetical protein
MWRGGIEGGEVFFLPSENFSCFLLIFQLLYGKIKGKIFDVWALGNTDTHYLPEPPFPKHQKRLTKIPN